MATAVKDIGSQRIDITTSKQIMRSVQKVVKDVSKMISSSSLYHHAIGIKSADGTSLASSFPTSASSTGLNSSGLSNTGLSSSFVGNTGVASVPANYVVGPATPLSAAIGPAAHSIQLQPGDYVPGTHVPGRPAHERVDTVMQPPPRQQSRRQLQQPQTADR